MPVEMNHSRFAQGALKASQGIDGRSGSSQPKQEYRPILRKEVQIVLQNYQIIFANFCVGCVSVFHVDLSVEQGDVAERVVDSADVGHVQLVTVRRGSQPSWRPRNSCVSPRLQIGVFCEIAEVFDAKLVGAALGHDERIGVVKTKLLRNAHSISGQFMRAFLQLR